VRSKADNNNDNNKAGVWLSGVLVMALDFIIIIIIIYLHSVQK